MNKLKRMTAFILILCTVLTYAVPVYADGVQNGTLALNSANSVVYYEYDPYMNELYRNETYDYTLVDSSCTSLELGAGKWYVIVGTVTLESRPENKSQLSDPANIILTNGCILNAPFGIENGSHNSLRIFGQDKDGGNGQLNINGKVPDNCAGIGGGYSPGMNAQGCGYVEINGGVLEIHGGSGAAGIGGGNGAADVSVTVNAGKVTAYGGKKGAGIGTGNGTTAQLSGNGKITVNGGTVEAHGGEWAAGIGRGYHGYPNAVEINGGNVTAIGGARGSAGIGGGKDTDGVDTKISGGTVCAIGNVDISYDAIGCGIGRGTSGYNDRSLTIKGEKISVYSGTDDTDATLTAADTYVRLREPYVWISSAKLPVYTVKWMMDDGTLIDVYDVTEGKMPVHSDPVKDGCIFTGWTPALAPASGDITYTARFYKLPNAHTFSENWTYNETHHWHACTCEDADCEGLVSDFGEHSLGEGETVGNTTVFTCECGYQKIVYNTAGDNEGELIEGVSYTGISLTLGSDVSINFYMQLSEEAIQKGTMTFDIGGRIVTVKGSEAKLNTKEGKYYFATPLNALEMAEKITATFNYNGTDYIQEYSVQEYIEEIVSDPDEYGEEAVLLAKKIANYGYYAQNYLASIHSNVKIGEGGYAAMNLHFDDVDIDIKKAKESLAKYSLDVSGGSDDLIFYGSTVYFDAATALNYYVISNKGEPTATAINTVTGEAKKVEITLYKDNIYIVSVKDITATELADDILVTVNGELTLEGAVFAYCNAVMTKDGQTDAAKSAMAAFCEYYEAACDYANMLSFPHYGTLEEYSWEELGTVSDAISKGSISAKEMAHFENFAENAETKKVVLNNDDVLYVRIIGFNHDTLSNGEGKAGISFMAVNSLDQGFYCGNKGSDSSDRAIGWGESPLRNKMQEGGEIYNLMPLELLSQIKQVDKQSFGGWLSNDFYDDSLHTTEDCLFLLSGNEIGSEFFGNGEGNKYQYIDRSVYPSDWQFNDATGILFSNVNAAGYEFIIDHISECNNIFDMQNLLTEAGLIVQCDNYYHSFLRSVSSEYYAYSGTVYYSGDVMRAYVWYSACVTPCFCV